MPQNLLVPPALLSDAFGSEAVVDGLPAEVIWDQERLPPADQQLGVGVGAATNRRVIAWVRRDQVTILQPGATILGGPPHHQKTWRVHSVDASDPQFHIAVMV